MWDGGGVLQPLHPSPTKISIYSSILKFISQEKVGVRSKSSDLKIHSQQLNNLPLYQFTCKWPSSPPA